MARFLALRLLVPIVLALAFSAVAEVPAYGQRPGAPQAPRGPQGGAPSEGPVTLLVSVRENNGMPLEASALVTLSKVAGSLHATSATRDGGTATFPDVRAGDYDIEVSAPSYKTATEHASIIGSGSTYTVYVYMQPESDAAVSAVPRGGPIMSPRLQSEIDKGLDKMRRQQYEAALAHFEKALKMAPGNPDILYLLGMLEYKQQHLEAARGKFEAAISIYPTHERALTALGELLLRAGQTERAAQTLEKVYQINGADWRVHLLLAHAYMAQRKHEEASAHAVRAAELGKEQGAPARLLLGQIFVAEGKEQEAVHTFGSLIKDFPGDPLANEAKAELRKLENTQVLVTERSSKADLAAETSAPIAIVTKLPVLVRPWAPADIDAKEYVVAPDVSCQQDEVIRRAQARSLRELGNFERFTATEHIEHQLVDPNGILGPVKSHDFNYVVFIQRMKDGSVFLEESRDGGENLDSFPTTLASKGLVSLGVALFDPAYASDLIYKCEGLGEYRGQVTWQIRFEQRKEVRSRLRTWRNRHGLFYVPLKGRVWVGANSYDVLHIETDLREPQKDLELNRDHLVIDYGAVQFQGGKTSLWLPWYAEMYMELHGKRYHHRHTLTNYAMFSVETANAISAPKEQLEQSEPHAEGEGPKP